MSLSRAVRKTIIDSPSNSNSFGAKFIPILLVLLMVLFTEKVSVDFVYTLRRQLPLLTTYATVKPMFIFFLHLSTSDWRTCTGSFRSVFCTVCCIDKVIRNGPKEGMCTGSNLMVVLIHDNRGKQGLYQLIQVLVDCQTLSFWECQRYH